MASAALGNYDLPQYKVRLEIPEIAFHFLLGRAYVHGQTKNYSFVWVLYPNVSLEEALEGVARVGGPDIICE